MIQPPLTALVEHQQKLCLALGLGAPTAPPIQVYGGLHHRMWQLDTSSGRFAIKQLAADVELDTPGVAEHFDITESVAEAFAAAGIRAIHALGNNGNYLQVLDSIAYLVYPWTDASAIDRRKLSEEHALKVASVLAAMHGADIQVDRVDAYTPEIQSGEKIQLLLEFAESRNARDHELLRQHLPILLRLADEHREAEAELLRNSVISHGDLDQKNVLWDEGQTPTIIDWESARRLNPTHELLLVALDWSGIVSAFQSSLFERFIGAYLQAGGSVANEQLRAAGTAVMGDWLAWLMFNVGRSFDIEDPQQRKLGSEQVDLALSTLLRLERLLPRLLDNISRLSRAA